MAELREIATGLRFPEGPIAMPDGSVVLVEMFGPAVSRVKPDGSKEVIAEIPGGPNGLAVGPDGALYVCNNGGCFSPIDLGGLMLPGPFDPGRYIGGRIQRLDISTGAVDRPLHRVRRPSATRPERHRVRHRGRLLVHRPRRARGAVERSHRHLLRQGRRVVDHRGDIPDRRAERHRALAGGRHGLLRGDPHGPRLPAPHREAR